MSLKGTSMYSFMTYLRSAIPPTVATSFNSEEKESGATNWNMMTFKTIRQLDNEEVEKVLGIQQDIKNSIAAEKSYYASLNTDVEQESAEDREMRTAESLLLGDKKEF